METQPHARPPHTPRCGRSLPGCPAPGPSLSFTASSPPASRSPSFSASPTPPPGSISEEGWTTVTLRRKGAAAVRKGHGVASGLRRQCSRSTPIPSRRPTPLNPSPGNTAAKEFDNMPKRPVYPFCPFRLSSDAPASWTDRCRTGMDSDAIEIKFVQPKNALRMWKSKGSMEIFSRENGFYFIKFGLAENLERVIQNGSWTFDGRLVVMRRWDPSSNFERDRMTTVPIWIRFTWLSPQLWCTKAIMKLTSGVGKPLCTDNATTNMECLLFASLDKLEIELPSEDIIFQKVEYEWVPPCCHTCKSFGHVLSQC